MEVALIQRTKQTLFNPVLINDFLILLTDAPLFVTRPTNAAGMPGDKLSLMCEVDANPRPSYKWYKVHAQTQERSLVGTSGNLTIEVSTSTGL